MKYDEGQLWYAKGHLKGSMETDHSRSFLKCTICEANIEEIIGVIEVGRVPTRSTHLQTFNVQDMLIQYWHKAFRSNQPRSGIIKAYFHDLEPV